MPAWKNGNMSIEQRTLEALNDSENWPSDLGLPLIKRGTPDLLVNRQVGVAVYLPTGNIRLYQNANIFEDPIAWKDPIILAAEDIVANRWEVVR